MVWSESLKSKFELENMIIKSNSDQPVYVKDVARVERSTGPVEIIREDQAKQIIVRADSHGILMLKTALACIYHAGPVFIAGFNRLVIVH